LRLMHGCWRHTRLLSFRLQLSDTDSEGVTMNAMTWVQGAAKGASRGAIRRPIPVTAMLVVLVAIWVAVPVGPATAETAGTVSRLQGAAFARAEGAADRRALEEGTTVDMGDVLSTGPDARLEIALADGGTLQLGENAAFVVDDLALGDGSGGFGQTALRLINGPFRLLGDHVGGEVQTRVAVIGIRGTDVWGGFINGGFGVLLQDGEVTVRTLGGVATLDEPGEGVMVFDPMNAPQDQKIWGQSMVDMAVESVAFSD